MYFLLTYNIYFTQTVSVSVEKLKNRCIKASKKVFTYNAKSQKGHLKRKGDV